MLQLEAECSNDRDEVANSRTLNEKLPRENLCMKKFVGKDCDRGAGNGCSDSNGLPEVEEARHFGNKALTHCTEG
eukprot:9393599-Karenia_brevis.AAC.1